MAATDNASSEEVKRLNNVGEDGKKEIDVEEKESEPEKKRSVVSDLLSGAKREEGKAAEETAKAAAQAGAMAALAFQPGGGAVAAVPAFGLPTGLPPPGMAPPAGLPPPGMAPPAFGLPAGLPPPAAGEDVQGNLLAAKEKLTELQKETALALQEAAAARESNAPKQLTDLQRLQRIQKAAIEKDMKQSLSAVTAKLTGKREEDDGGKRKFGNGPVQPIGGVKRLKIQMCPLFEMGGCTKGAMCQHAHNEEELATQAEVDAQLHEEALAMQNAALQMGAQQAQAQAPPGPGECKDFRRGSCTRGDSCRFSHVGTPGAPEASGWSDRGGDKAGWSDKSKWSGGAGGAGAGGGDWKDWNKDKAAGGEWKGTATKWPEGDDSWKKDWVKDDKGFWQRKPGTGYQSGWDSKVANNASGAAAAMASGQDLVVTDPEAAWRQLEEAYISQGTTPEQWAAFQLQVEEGCAQQGIVRGQWAAAFLASLAAGENVAGPMG